MRRVSGMYANRVQTNDANEVNAGLGEQSTLARGSNLIWDHTPRKYWQSPYCALILG